MTHFWRIVREPSALLATMGSLYFNGTWGMWTLEDQIRELVGRPVAEWKVDGETAIPAGRYLVTLSFSNRLQRLTPEVHDVRGFSGIRLHSGNKRTDTLGCPLVGFQRANAAIVGGTSRPAETEMVERLKAAKDTGDDTWLVVENPPVFT